MSTVGIPLIDGAGNFLNPGVLTKILAAVPTNSAAPVVVTAGAAMTPSTDTTGATDRAAIQAAIDAAHTAGGGFVTLLGHFTINASLVLRTGVFLVGYGWSASQIHLAANANCKMVTLDSQTMWFGARDLMLDGHREDQSAGEWDGFDLSTTNNYDASTAFGQCTVAFLERVLVQYAKGSGFHIEDGQVEDRFTDCYAFSCGISGFKSTGGSDMWFTNCTSGESLGDGFEIEGQVGVRMHGCKSWWSGRQNAVRGNGNPGSGNGTSLGFRIAGQNIQISNCEAQDNSGGGAAIAATSGYIQMTLDSNGSGSNNSAAAYLGYMSDCNVHLTIGTNNGRTTTPYAASIASTVLRSDIYLMCTQNGVAASLRPDSAVDASNHVTIRGAFTS